MSKQFVISDVHGGYKALLQCLERSKFNKENDELFVLGDVTDGWPEVKECIDELMAIKNLVYIIGNHDQWTLEWMTLPREIAWTRQGGQATFNSYVPQEHIEFLKNGHLWYHDEEKNRLFVHGGFEPDKSMNKQEVHICLWDRMLFDYARLKHNQKPDYTYGGFDEIYLGHTSTLFFKKTKPMHVCNIWNMDTGGGGGGRLSIQDLNTKEIWQSDLVKELYKGIEGRK